MSLHEERYRRVIRKLVEVRKRLGLSQTTVASRLVLDPLRPTKRVTQSFVSKCENRERRLDAVELADFARVYGISVSELLGAGDLPAGAALARDGDGDDWVGAVFSADVLDPPPAPPALAEPEAPAKKTRVARARQRHPRR